LLLPPYLQGKGCIIEQSERDCNGLKTAMHPLDAVNCIQ